MAKHHGKKENSNSEVKPRVDLGLSALVASLNNNEPTNPSTSSIENILEEATTITIHKTTSYESLADKNSWSELLALSENEMSSSNNSDVHVATIWWALSQLELDGVPPSILASSVEKASTEIERFSNTSSGSIIEPKLVNTRLKKECAALLIRLSRRLISTLSDKHPISFIQRAVVLEPTLKNEAITIIDNETERLKKLTGRKQLRDARLSELDLIKNKIQKIGCITSEVAEPKSKPSLSHQTKVQSSPITAKTTQGLSNSKIVIVVSILIVLSMVGYWLLSRRETILGSAPISGEITNPKHIVPSEDRLKSINNIDALLLEVNSNSGGAISPSNSSTKEDPKPTVTVVQSERVLEDKKAPLVGVKEKIDTTGPVEGATYYEREERDSVSDSNNVFGSPPPSMGGLEQSPQSQGKQRFQGGKIFRIISSTKVMSQASYVSSTIARLEAGARVEVTEKLGQWLKIRSRMGQSGYILAQDAEILQ